MTTSTFCSRELGSATLSAILLSLILLLFLNEFRESVSSTLLKEASTLSKLRAQERAESMAIQTIEENIGDVSSTRFISSHESIFTDHPNRPRRLQTFIHTEDNRPLASAATTMHLSHRELLHKPNWDELLAIPAKVTACQFAVTTENNTSLFSSAYQCSYDTLTLSEDQRILGNLEVSDTLSLKTLNNHDASLIVYGSVSIHGKLLLQGAPDSVLTIIASGDISIHSIDHRDSDRARLHLHSIGGNISLGDGISPTFTCENREKLRFYIEAVEGDIYLGETALKKRSIGCEFAKDRFVWPSVVILGGV